MIVSPSTGILLFRPLKSGEELCIRVFQFFYHAKPGTTNNHRTRLSNISYESPFQDFQNIGQCREKPI